MAKVDFRGKPLTVAELRARREARERAAPVRTMKKKGRPRFTQVASVSIPKHLKIRCELEIGNGSFSAGVVKAVTAYLSRLDKERELLS